MGWKLVTLDENKHGGNAPKFCHVVLRSASFRLLVMGVILANGVVTATMHFKHDGRPRHIFYEKYYYIEVNETLCDPLSVSASCYNQENVLIMMSVSLSVLTLHSN